MAVAQDTIGTSGRFKRGGSAHGSTAPFGTGVWRLTRVAYGAGGAGAPCSPVDRDVQLLQVLHDPLGQLPATFPGAASAEIGAHPPRR